MKKVIISITPNPALDLSGTVNNIKPNEKAYVHDERRAPGGNAINSARILQRLGVPVLASGFLGGGTGKEIQRLLEREELRHSFIKISGTTRINVTVSNKSDHKQTRLSFPGPMLSRAEVKALVDFVSARQDISLLIIGGSLPPGFGSAEIVGMIKMARKKGIQVIVDCPGPVLAKVVKSGPLLIKPNLEEFQELTQSRVKTIHGVLKKSRELLSSVEMICVSSVEGGALFITKQEAFFGKIPKVRVRSTVGAGDSMVGAMAAQLHKGETRGEEILRWGLAAAAATLIQPGTTLGTATDINREYRRIQIRKV